MVKGKDLIELRRNSARYVEEWKAKGGKVTNYCCSHCHNSVDTPRPAKDDVDSRGYWNSLMACPHCGSMNHVCVYPSGKTTVKMGPP